MKKWLMLAVCMISAIWAHGQQGDLQQTARNYLRTGDYANAILVLNQAIQNTQDNFELKRDLALAYYLKGENNRAYTVIQNIIDKKEADVHTFQIAGNIYQQKQDWKGAEKLYARGLKKFPRSGELHNDYGELLQHMRNYDGALRNWVKGIEVDPSFASNYYNASRSYAWTKEPIWAVFYGETFINLESYSARTAEIRELLLECYKKLFDDPNVMQAVALAPTNKNQRKGSSGSNEFVDAFKNTLSKQISVIATGIETETLTMLRTRFLLEWDQRFKHKFPFALFDFHKQLLKLGYFDAYNQWLFGPASNQAAYKSWTTLNKENYDAFTTYIRSNPLRVREDEFYNTGKIPTIGR